MASLQARSPLRSTHPFLLLNKIVSLTAFLVLLCAGWIVLSYLKSEISPRATRPSPDPAVKPYAVVSPGAGVRVGEAGTVEARPLLNPVRLVYSYKGDSEHYHIATHLPTRCERSALSEEAAMQRGLKPCTVCMPE